MKQRHQSNNIINCYESENNLFLREIGHRISQSIFSQNFRRDRDSWSDEVTCRYSVTESREMAVLEIHVVHKQASSSDAL